MRILIFIFFLFSIGAKSQIEFDKSLKFVNETDSMSQINNLGNAADSSDILNFGITTSEKILTFRLTGSGTYSFLIPYNGFQLKTGMQFHFFIDTTNSSYPNIALYSNNYPILLQNGDSIPSNGLQNNSVIRTIFDGSSFLVTQYFRNTCPSGFYSVNKNYCIEINERPVKTYTNAIHTCNLIGANLCSWAEWFYACSHSSANVSNMTNNWEFIDDASDHTDTYAIVGLGGCQGFSSENINLFNRNFRCCYKK